MCNPSDADARRDDPTMLRVMEFSLRWGFGSCVVINAVPRISPDPAMAMAWIRLVDRGGEENRQFQDQYRENIEHCSALMLKAQMAVAAWGNMLPHDYVREWYQSIAERSVDDLEWQEREEPFQWHCLGTTASGSPKHPLARGHHRVPDDFKPMLWNGAA
jgi:hypothetical protein